MSFLKELDSRRDRRFYKHLAPIKANLTLRLNFLSKKRRGKSAASEYKNIMRYFTKLLRTRD